MVDFFEQQRRARQRARLLVVLYLLGVLAVAVAITPVTLAMACVILHIPMKATNHASEAEGFRSIVVGIARWVVGTGDGRLAGTVAMGTTVALVFGTSWWRYLSLSEGGRSVAASLSGRKIQPNTTDVAERRLLNVVEEMSIASATPVPPVYVMDTERAINAFAAGFSPSDAVIAVTRGALYRLNREQLQGLVAHEFSHILGGDMRLNMRLIALLYGVIAVQLLGRLMLDAGVRESRFRSRDDGKGRLAIIVVGVLLIVIGSVGALVSKLIKAAISRQCEYLADAAAVQFTRDPETIAGALKAVGGTISAGEMQNPAAEECSHMFFVQGTSSWLESAFATHPPLRDRILKLTPNWDGKWIRTPDLPGPDGETYDATTGERQFVLENLRARATARAGAAPGIGMVLGATVGGIAAGQEATRSAPGSLSEEEVFLRMDKARELLDSLNVALLHAARDAHDARALLAAMLIKGDDATRTTQRQRIAEGLGEAVGAQAAVLRKLLDSAPEEALLPLIDISLGSLSALSKDQYQAFRSTIDAVALVDHRIDQFEWCLRRLMVAHLDRALDRAPMPRPLYYALHGLRDECELVLSAVVWAGGVDSTRRQAAMKMAGSRLRLGDLELAPASRLTAEALDGAVEKLMLATVPVKRQIVSAAAAIVGDDGTITPSEADLLRVIADSLGVGGSSTRF